MRAVTAKPPKILTAARAMAISPVVFEKLASAGPAEMHLSKIVGFIAVALAAVNIFGGFAVTQRMLQMYKKK